MNDTRLLRVWVITIITEYLDSIPINLVPIEFLWYDSLNTQIRRTKWPICFVLGTRAVLCTGKGDIGSFLEHSVQRKHLLKKLSIKQELTTSVSKIVMIVLRFIFSLTTYLFTRVKHVLQGQFICKTLCHFTQKMMQPPMQCYTLKFAVTIHS